MHGDQRERAASLGRAAQRRDHAPAAKWSCQHRSSSAQLRRRASRSAEIARRFDNGLLKSPVGHAGKVGKVIALMDVASNVTNVGRGIDNMTQNGVTWQNGLQVVGGVAGLGGNYAGTVALGANVAPGATSIWKGSFKYGPRVEAAKTTVPVPRGRAPEIPSGQITESGVLRQAENYLGRGYKEVSPGRYVSADGTRQFRYGAHETRNPANHHAHFESLQGGRVTENAVVKIVPDP